VLGNLNALSDDVRQLIEGVQEGKGSLGKLLTDEQAYHHLNSLLAKGEGDAGEHSSGPRHAGETGSIGRNVHEGGRRFG